MDFNFEYFGPLIWEYRGYIYEYMGKKIYIKIVTIYQ